MAIRTTEAVILRVWPFRTSSLIVTAFTRDFGKIQGLAKGIRLRCSRKDKKYNCFLEPLTLNKIVYYEKKRPVLYSITQCDLLNQFQPVRQDLKKLGTASFMLELVDKGTQLEDNDRDIFKLLVSSLSRLCEDGNDLKEILLFFQMQFLKLSGFMPKDNKLNMSVMDFIRLHIASDFKTLEFMEKIKNG